RAQQCKIQSAQEDRVLARCADQSSGDASCGLLVSPHHRILYTGHKANMLFGASEVLVAAKDLVNGRDIRRRPVSEIKYIHLMFDHHEVIYADGIATESFQATDPVLTALEDAAREAVFSFFPELRVAAGRHLVPARTCVSEEDARMLSEQGSSAAYYA
ncbi:MAG: Hint domain-containing protein, partial [Pseudomonadota bacterium]